MSLLKNFPDLSQEITIVINEDNPQLSQTFTVSQGFLTEHSVFFEATCRNGWEEATIRTIKLPDVDNGAFGAYLYWIHKEKIPFEIYCDLDGCPSSNLHDHEASPTLAEIIKLWLLADRLMTAKLRNAAADAILSILKIVDPGSDMEGVFPAYMINMIWSAKQRTLRYDVFEDSMKNEEYHLEFLKDLASKGLSISHQSDKPQHPNEWQKQQAGHYHELDKPHPRSNIHGTAEIDLEDENGTLVRYRCTLLLTPKDYVDAVHKALSPSDTSEYMPEVKVQMKRDVWAAFKEDRWNESFGKIAESSHFERVSFEIVFDDYKSPKSCVFRESACVIAEFEPLRMAVYGIQAQSRLQLDVDFC